MKRYFKWIIFGLFLVSMVVIGFTIQLIFQIRSYSTLINYVGVVRGATQRLVKLEMCGQPNDELIAYLDGILMELNTGEGVYGLTTLHDATYNYNLVRLGNRWEALKDEIGNVRRGKAPDVLLAESEEYFTIANDTVFAADQYATRQAWRLSIRILEIVVVAALTWGGIFFFTIRLQTRLEQDNRGLTDIVYKDALTGAPNLEKFQMEAQQLLTRYPHASLAVVYADFENFKCLNDIFGRPYGDKLLQEYANILAQSVDEGECFCRISADSFLILRRYATREELISRQQTVDERVLAYALDTPQKNLIRLCGGICCKEDTDGQIAVEGLIERANFARKTVKNNPRMHYAFYDESIRQKMISEQVIENQMHAALENEEFIVYLQPKVGLHTNKIESAEALVRWRTASGTLIPPNDFIPLFEKDLFIIQLDQYMLEHVCQWLRMRMDAGQRVVSVSVNVSRMQLYDSTFVETYAAVKRRYQIPDGMLEIEFTESVVFEDMTLLLEIIHTLKRQGFRCSLDDFGKGYSSLNLLKRLPVDVLKLDGLFFEEDENEEQANRARTVVEGIVSMARSLRLKTVAEGVEHEEQVKFLRSIGCDQVQGYVFFRPMPVVQLGQLLDENK